jgi:hypothetical protein
MLLSIICLNINWFDWGQYIQGRTRNLENVTSKSNLAAVSSIQARTPGIPQSDNNTSIIKQI